MKPKRMLPIPPDVVGKENAFEAIVVWAIESRAIYVIREDALPDVRSWGQIVFDIALSIAKDRHSRTGESIESIMMQLGALFVAPIFKDGN